MPVITRAAAALCVAFALPLASHPAAALPQSPAGGGSPAQWGGAHCASGHLDGVRPDPLAGLVVLGAATRCDGDTGTHQATFAVVSFGADEDPKRPALVGSDQVREYLPNGQPRSFGTPVAPWPVTRAVCLMADADTRLACAAVTPLTGAVPFHAIPLDDPRADGPVSAGLERATTP